MDPFIGEIKMFAGSFAPRDWALCNGQLLPIAQNAALFSILGTTYGGNGQTTFGLPDLRGRAPIHEGQGPGLTPRALGESAGSETVTLITTEIPSHNHLVNATTIVGDQVAQGNILAAQGSDAGVGATTNNFNVPATTPLVQLSPTALTNTGGSQPHNNMQPYLAVNFIIALNGVFPSRN